MYSRWTWAMPVVQHNPKTLDTAIILVTFISLLRCVYQFWEITWIIYVNVNLYFFAVLVYQRETHVSRRMTMLRSVLFIFETYVFYKDDNVSFTLISNVPKNMTLYYSSDIKPSICAIRVWTACRCILTASCWRSIAANLSLKKKEIVTAKHNKL